MRQSYKTPVTDRICTVLYGAAFTAQCNMVYAFVIPMMFAVMPYHDVKAFVLINVGTVVENILVVLLGATQGGFGYLGQDAGFIQISVMILLCITSIYATISNQKNTDEI